MIKIGIGYDIHKLVPNRELIIGGVKIPFNYGLLGHSDADVLLHAIIDSMLGASALGDIGTIFPNTDERYFGISSRVLLTKTNQMLVDHGFLIVNIDTIVVTEEPKLMPYVLQIRNTIANDLNLNINQVGLKAKTNEGLDSVGQQNAVSAHAVCLLEYY